MMPSVKTGVKTMMQRAMKKSFLVAFSLVVLMYTSLGTAYYVSPSFKSPKAPIATKTDKSCFWQNLVVATALLMLPIVGEPALAMSETAAQIQLNAVPPSTIQIQIGDLPVIGGLVSGTYARVDPNAAALVGKALGSDGEQAQKAASIIITSPPDKGKAIKDIASSGHLEFDVSGIMATHLDVDVSTPTAGELIIKVKSPILPKLPFKPKD